MPSRNLLMQQLDANQQVFATYRPFTEPHVLRELQKFYRVDATYSSNALEGCTYTLSETKILLEDGLTAGGKPMREAYAVLGHAKAFDHMFTLMHNKVLTEEDILTMHAFLAGGLENDATAGKYRDVPVFITGSKYETAPVHAIPARMAALCACIQEHATSMHPVLLAAQVHKELAFIHPFADGNGRLARLAMNTLLIQRGFLPVIIPPVLRAEYIASLEQAHEDDAPFVDFIARCALESQKDMLRLLRGNGFATVDT